MGKYLAGNQIDSGSGDGGTGRDGGTGDAGGSATFKGKKAKANGNQFFARLPFCFPDAGKPSRAIGAIGAGEAISGLIRIFFAISVPSHCAKANQRKWGENLLCFGSSHYMST